MGHQTLTAAHFRSPFIPMLSTDKEYTTMNTTASQDQQSQEQRIFSRVAYCDEVRYEDGQQEQGTAHCTDIGWGGTALNLGRYLRPGTRVCLSFKRPDQQGNALTLEGEVSWCTPAQESHRFLAGVRASLKEGEAMEALSALMLNAVLHQDAAVVGRSASDGDDTSPLPRWTLGQKGSLEVA